MSYFSNLAEGNNDIAELINTLKKYNQNILRNSDEANITSIVEMLMGIAAPEKFNKYSLLDSHKTLDALFIFNGLVPLKDTGLLSYLEYCHRTENAYKQQEHTEPLNDSEIIQKAIKQCAIDLRSDNLLKLAHTKISALSVNVTRLDGLSTWSINTLPTEILDHKEKIKLSFLRVTLDDLRSRLLNIQNQLTIWESGDHSEKPSLQDIKEWAHSKNIKPNFSLHGSDLSKKRRVIPETDIIIKYKKIFKYEKQREFKNATELFNFMRQKAKSGAKDLSIADGSFNSIIINEKEMDKEAFRKRLERRLKL